ncbi:Asp/Glu/hydantoin racemase [Pontibacter ummariensis]|uniref:Asp/Glu/Hydantoin racemase n=1 Tax=Pontibacter ummariensis TaxID=1610492 RepID=A0A239LZR8_9BACT|nr:aspartate/glutamate racemase family protein [Pontibacter ummariensis]PRX99274.1 Asp/Glu/hydantoin racemase [Pontibacter ummariensis]SNT35885.1 Asp/Glu/Hydantoin racemase [Pontibacter ummariensis]
MGLLGTKFTMEGDFLRKRLWDMHQINTIVPDQQSRDRVHAIIHEELVKGNFTESSRQK